MGRRRAKKTGNANLWKWLWSSPWEHKPIGDFDSGSKDAEHEERGGTAVSEASWRTTTETDMVTQYQAPGHDLRHSTSQKGPHSYFSLNSLDAPLVKQRKSEVISREDWLAPGPITRPRSTGSDFSRTETLKQYTPSDWPRSRDVDLYSAMMPSRNDTISKTSTVQDKADDSTTFHIYHSGKNTLSYAIRRMKDADIPLPQFDDPTAPNYVDDEKWRARKPCWTHRACAAISRSTRIKRIKTDSEHAEKTVRYLKRHLVVDKPGLDPRFENTDDFFLHLPIVCWHSPARILRRGGNKRSPPICVVKNSLFWKTWRLQFSDRLAEPGVVDGRGVIPRKYGTKNGKGGTMKGYKFKTKSCRGQSGKEWQRLERERRKDLSEAERNAEDAQSEPILPDEVVAMRWTKPFSFSGDVRRYDFTWRGVEFSWRGTNSVKDTKKWGWTVGWNHCKLMMRIPDGLRREDIVGSESDGDEGMEEMARSGERKTDWLMLARFTSVASHRKSGRLEILDKRIRRVFDLLIQPEIKSSDYTDPRDQLAKLKVRFDDIVLGTAMCMSKLPNQERIDDE
jgi:hypothetical protein